MQKQHYLLLFFLLPLGYGPGCFLSEQQGEHARAHTLKQYLALWWALELWRIASSPLPSYISYLLDYPGFLRVVNIVKNKTDCFRFSVITFFFLNKHKGVIIKHFLNSFIK